MARFTVRDLLQNRLGVPTIPEFGALNLTAGAPATTILKNDPSRVAFIIINLGTGAIVVLPTLGTPPSAGRGIRIEPNGGALLSRWEDDGEMVGYEWQAISVSGVNAITTLANIIAAGLEAKEPRQGVV